MNKRMSKKKRKKKRKKTIPAKLLKEERKNGLNRSNTQNDRIVQKIPPSCIRDGTKFAYIYKTGNACVRMCKKRKKHYLVVVEAIAADVLYMQQIYEDDVTVGDIYKRVFL